MSKLNEFIDVIKAEVNVGIYVIGGNGEYATEDAIRRRESGKHLTDALNLYRKRVAQGLKPRMEDCSGLGILGLRSVGVIGSKDDYTANGLYGKCKNISKSYKKSALRKGYWVFKHNGTRATHIGYVVNDNGDIVSSKGRAYGVVLNESGWNRYGIPSYFAEDIPTPPKADVCRVLKKGCKGEDVKLVQKTLTKYGYWLNEDGVYGTKTVSAVKAWQKAQSITVDGKVGEKTTKSLGLVWGG